MRLLASAMAGRPVEVAELEAGEPAWTDGTTIYVDPGSSPVEQLAVQASLLAGGSLDPAIVGAFVRRPALARRYLAVEGHRALAANELFLPPTIRSLADPGYAVASPEESLALARSRQPLPDPPAAFGTLRVRRLLAAGEGNGVPSAEPEPKQVVSASAAQELDEDAEGGDVGHVLSSPVGGEGLLGRLLKRLLGASRGERGDGPAGADAPTHTGRARDRRGDPVTLALTPAAPDGDASPAFGRPRTATYPEWDADRRTYRPDWCTVQEREAQDAAAVVLRDGRALRRSLARLGAGLDRVRRRPQGDDIDIDAVVEAQVDVLSDGMVYVESLRRRRNLSVLILLDISGSAAEPGPGGRSVHDHQRYAAAALASAFHDLGDRVAVQAFNSHGRTAVNVTRVKAFDDRLDGRVLRRLGGLAPEAYTRLGAAIRHGTATVMQQGGTARRLLVVLSDGFAYDHGYGGRYGEADASRALTEARRRGIGCVCLSIGASTPPAALARVFGSAAHAAVPTADHLPPLVGPLFRAAIRSAEAQRRTFQRTQAATPAESAKSASRRTA